MQLHIRPCLAFYSSEDLLVTVPLTITVVDACCGFLAACISGVTSRKLVKSVSPNWSVDMTLVVDAKLI